MKKLKSFVRVADLQAGHKIPLFYLPVRMHIERYAVEAWLFPIAPFILVYRVLVSMFWAIWADLNEFIGLQTLKYKKD